LDKAGNLVATCRTDDRLLSSVAIATAL